MLLSLRRFKHITNKINLKSWLTKLQRIAQLAVLALVSVLWVLFQQVIFTKLILTYVLIAVLALTHAQWVLSFRLNF